MSSIGKENIYKKLKIELPKFDYKHTDTETVIISLSDLARKLHPKVTNSERAVPSSGMYIDWDGDTETGHNK